MESVDNLRMLILKLLYYEPGIVKIIESMTIQNEQYPPRNWDNWWYTDICIEALCMRHDFKETLVQGANISIRYYVSITSGPIEKRGHYDVCNVVINIEESIITGNIYISKNITEEFEHSMNNIQINCVKEIKKPLESGYLECYPDDFLEEEPTEMLVKWYPERGFMEYDGPEIETIKLSENFLRELGKQIPKLNMQRYCSAITI